MSEEASAPGEVSRSLLKTSVGGSGQAGGPPGRSGHCQAGVPYRCLSQALVAAHCNSHQPSPQASAVIRCDARRGQGSVTEAGALNSCLGERLPDRKGSELVLSVLNRSGGSPRH